MEFFCLSKQLNKILKGTRLLPEVKAEESTPDRERAKAMANAEKMIGSSLSSAIQEPRPAPTTLGGAHDHGLTAHMSLAAYGTMLGNSAKSHDDSLTEILTTIDTFKNELKGTAVQSAGSLDASSAGHQLAYTIFGRILCAIMQVTRPHRDVEFYTELADMNTNK